MRSVHLSDLNMVARTLLPVCECCRGALVKTLLEQAHTADKYRKRTGRAHAIFGNGTLSAACARHIKAPMPDRCDLAYLRCLGDVIAGILNMRIDENL